VIVYDALDFSPSGVNDSIFSLRNLRKRF
jgi:hypothetical protein